MNAAVPIPPDRFSIVIVTTNREILLPFNAKTIKTKLDNNWSTPAINKDNIIPNLDIITPPTNKPTKVAPSP